LAKDSVTKKKPVYDIATGVQQLQSEDSKFHELAIEFDRLKSHASHVESQNQVLELSLEDSKSLNEQVSKL
jgi:hypothetical protein